MQVEINPEAIREIREALDYLDAIDPDLGDSLLEIIEQSVAQIRAHPLYWPKRKYGTRRYLLNRFSYAIHYRFLGDTITILAFAHTAKRPYYWKERADST